MRKIDGFLDRNVHYRWDRRIEPIEHIAHGETVSISIPDSSTKQITRASVTNDLKGLDENRIDGLIGPLYVRDAEPGNVLRITIERMKVGDWGWTAIFSRFGILGDMFDDHLFIWDIRDGYASSATEGFLEDLNLSIRPFLGIAGTAPTFGKYPVIPPQQFGGNMDNSFLCEGAVLYLPVNVPGAMISFADPHAAQGDGEVCGSAIETSCNVDMKIEVIKGRTIRYPIIESAEKNSGNVVVCTGIHNDLRQASQLATLNMIEYLVLNGYTEEEAYVLCSIKGNLKISEAVDMPNYVVSMSMESSVANARRNTGAK